MQPPETTAVPDRAAAGPEGEPNRQGHARAMTVFSLVKPGGVNLLRLVLSIGRRQRPSVIRDLSSIHFARLAIIRRFPDHDQPPDELRQPLLLFESNYNGMFDQYIEDFTDAIPVKMTAFWQTSYGFPGVVPVSWFKAYIRANEFTVDHYYCAYSRATTRTIAAALRLRARHAEFYERARTLSPERFVREYRAFLTEVQGDL
jgi:hypothetical protein